MFLFVLAATFAAAPQAGALESTAIPKTTRVSVNGLGHQANQSVGYMSISNSGRFVVFESNADNLVPHETNGESDVFVRDRRAKTTKRVSVSSAEKQVMTWSGYAHISPSGRFVLSSHPLPTSWLGTTTGSWTSSSVTSGTA